MFMKSPTARNIPVVVCGYNFTYSRNILVVVCRYNSRHPMNRLCNCMRIFFETFLSDNIGYNFRHSRNLLSDCVGYNFRHSTF